MISIALPIIWTELATHEFISDDAHGIVAPTTGGKFWCRYGANVLGEFETAEAGKTACQLQKDQNVMSHLSDEAFLAVTKAMADAKQI